MAKNPFGLSGVAATDLTMGMGSARFMGAGDALRGQVDELTEEEKRKRALGLSTMQQTGSMAVSSLFGPPAGALGRGISGALGRLGGGRAR
jgi:hypothetical protein